MALTRSSFRTATEHEVELYSDFVLDFGLNPVTGALGRVVNAECVSQFLRTLLLTDEGEWPFESRVGTRVRRSLFEPSDQISLDLLGESIADAIRQKAPMISLVGVNVVPNLRADAVSVVVAFRTADSPSVVLTTIVLTRAR